jgi:hypothetical protein
LKSIRFFTQTFWGICNANVELLEFNSLADYERYVAKVMKEPEMIKMHEESSILIDPATYTMEVWKSIK